MDHYGQGLELLKRGKPAEAVAHFDRAISVIGPKYDILDAQASAYEKLADWSGVMKCARRLIEGYADKARGYIRAARALGRRGEWERAVQMLELAVPLSASSKQAALQDQLDDYRRRCPGRPPAVDPISRLPTDVWSMILSHGVDESPDFAIAASQVSRSWRSAVLSLHEGWKDLSMAPKRGKVRAQLAKAKAWMSRSRGNLRSVRLDLSKGPQASEAELEELATILLPATERLRQLFVSCQHTSSFTDVWEGKLRRLRDLEISYMESTTTSSPSPTITCHMLHPDSRSLRKLAVREGYILRNDIMPEQLAGLEELVIAGRCRHYTIRELASRSVNFVSPVHELLSCTPKLVHAEFAYISVGDSGPVLDEVTSLTPRATLPALTSWSQTVRPAATNPFSILEKVNMPGVQNISFTGFDSDLISDISRLTSAGVLLSNLRRVSFTRQRLTINDDLRMFLGELRGLEAFTLLETGEGVTKLSLPSLSASPERWPKLTELEVDAGGHIGGSLVKIVETRLPRRPSERQAPPGREVDVNTEGLTPISRLVLHNADALSKEAETWLRDHVPDFRCIRPTSGKPTYRDRMR